VLAVESQNVAAGSVSKILRAVERVHKADAKAAEARKSLRALMREEIDAGRVTKSEIARALGVSRQRVQRMLEQ
jgi:DNA invertase Pin-like site-specific DNA recombinase